MKKPFIGGDVNNIYDCTLLFMFCKHYKLQKSENTILKLHDQKKCEHGYFVYIICREGAWSVCVWYTQVCCDILFCIQLFSAFGLYVYVVFHFVRIVL